MVKVHFLESTSLYHLFLTDNRQKPTLYSKALAGTSYAGFTPNSFHSHRLKTQRENKIVGALQESQHAPAISIV